MDCFVCLKNKNDTFHHVSYIPTVLIPVCDECHKRIHYGDYFLLDPRRCKEFCWEDNYIYGSNVKDQENTMPEHLRIYVRIAFKSEIVTTYEKLYMKSRLKRGGVFHTPLFISMNQDVKNGRLLKKE